MSRALSILPLTAALAFAFALGFLARRSTDRDADAPRNAPSAAGELLESAVTETDSAPEPIADLEDLPEAALASWKDDEFLDAALACYRWLGLVDAETIEARLERWRQAEIYLPTIMRECAFARWAELDPARLAELHGDDRDAQLALWIARVRKDPAMSLADCPDDWRPSCLRYLAARHPSFDLAWARERGVSTGWFVRIWLQRGLKASDLLVNSAALDDETVSAIFSYEALQAKTNPRTAAHLTDLLETVSDPALLEAARNGIAQGALAAEPLTTLKLLHELEISLTRQPQGRNLFEDAISERPDETIDWILTLESEARKQIVDGIFSNTLSGSPDTIGWTDLYLRLPREELPTLSKLGMYFHREISHAPTVLSWFEEMQRRDHFVPGEDENLGKKLFLDWARAFGTRLAFHGMEGAVEQIRQVEDETLRGAFLAGLGEQVATFNLEAARALVPELNGAERGKLETAIFAREFEAMSTDEALESLAAIPEDERQTHLANALLFDSKVSPERRGAVVDAMRDEVPDLFGSSLSLVIEWANQAPQDAAHWITQYADHPQYPRNAEELVEHWARHDLAGAAHWVLAQESGAARDRSVEVIAEEAVEQDPHAAIEWAASITDPESRLERLQDAVLAIDRHAARPDEAIDALAALDLTDTERAQLLERLQSDP